LKNPGGGNIIGGPNIGGGGGGIPPGGIAPGEGYIPIGGDGGMPGGPPAPGGGGAPKLFIGAFAIDGGGGGLKAPRGSIGPCPGGGCGIIVFGAIQKEDGKRSSQPAIDYKPNSGGLPLQIPRSASQCNT
jgi:hypothetical protein